MNPLVLSLVGLEKKLRAANQNASVRGTVTGNVTYGTSLTTGPFTHIGGATQVGTLATAPQPFVPITLPPADSFTSGGADVTDGGTATSPLAPAALPRLTDAELAAFRKKVHRVYAAP